MKKKIFRSIICFLLTILLVAECSQTTGFVFAAPSEDADIEETEEETDTEETANEYLYPFEEAVNALETLAEQQEIPAVVYLADTITLRKLPENDSEPVKELSSGEMVRIIGAGQDTGYGIWYQVSYQDDVETVTGYVKGDYVACVDEEFIQWQESYIRSIRMYGLGEDAYADVESFPASYQSALRQLKQKHPNWIFVKMDTGVDWNTLVKEELGDKNLVYVTSPENWKNGRYGTTSWYYASEGILKYYLDPRNWLAENNIFQFELLGYDAQYHTVDLIENLLSGSFMANTTIENGKTYAQNFVEIGRMLNVSPVLMATRIRQEQGQTGNSALISGTYAGYEGYYNFYNIGASGTTDKETIVSGLQKAKEKGWDSRYKSLVGGAEFLGNGYISVGQNTLYLQKFDVVANGGYFSHQYMQNIQAPYTEGRKVYQTYSNKGLLNQAFIFRIPVYKNMPAKAAVLPGNEDKITLNSTQITNLQVDSTITLHPYINGKEAEGVEWVFTSSNPEVAEVDAFGVVTALKAGKTTITCKNAEDPDNPNIGTCEITVVTAQIDLSGLEVPELDPVVYAPDQTLGDIALPEGYSWVNPDMVPTAGQSSYGVVYNPNEEKYQPITFDLPLTVNKKILTAGEYTLPSGLEGSAGGELSSINLPKGYYWDEPDTKLADKIGTYEYPASYNPDYANYETVTGLKIAVKVICVSHQYGEWEVTKATCEMDGKKVRTCSVCGNKEELVLEKTGHSYDMKVTQEATEEKEGVRTYSCKNCGDSYTESIPKLPSSHVHKYEERIDKKASCTETGVKVWECSCGDHYTEEIAATGHKMENGRCQLCGYAEVEEKPSTGDTNTEKPNSGSTSNGNTSTEKPNNGSGSTEKPNSGNTNSGNTSTEKPSTDNSNTEKPNNGSTSNGSTSNGNTSTETPSGGNTETTQPSTGNTSNSNTNTEKPNSGSTNNGNASTEQPSNGSTNNSNTNSGSTNNGNTSTEKPNNGSGSTETTQPSNGTTSTQVSAYQQAEADIISDVIENSTTENTTNGEKQKVSVQLSKNTEISRTIVEMAKEHDVDLEIELSNSLKWVIQTDSLSDSMSAAVNMNAQIVQDVVEQEVIEQTVGQKEYMELRLSHDGEFGFGASLIVPVEEKYKGQTANLFYFNEATGKLEFQMSAPVDEEGNIRLEFVHASDYVIVFAAEAMDDTAVYSENEVNTEVEETEIEENSDTSEKGVSGFLLVCVVIMILAGSLAAAGYVVYVSKKDSLASEEEPNFKEWLKKDPVSVENIQQEDQEEYLDDDVDDYQEKEDTAECGNTGRMPSVAIAEEEYLDDDVDDYQEKD